MLGNVVPGEERGCDEHTGSTSRWVAVKMETTEVNPVTFLEHSQCYTKRRVAFCSLFFFLPICQLSPVFKVCAKAETEGAHRDGRGEGSSGHGGVEQPGWAGRAGARRSGHWARPLIFPTSPGSRLSPRALERSEFPWKPFLWPSLHVISQVGCNQTPTRRRMSSQTAVLGFHPNYLFPI